MAPRKKKRATKKKATKKKATTTRRGRGRPTLISKELADEIATYVEAGNYLETSFRAAGIADSTGFLWLKKGRRARRAAQKTGKPIPRELKAAAEFSEAIEKATAKGEIRDMETIRLAARKQWQAAAWRLERKYPDRYGRRDRHEHSGPGGNKPIPLVAEVTLVGSPPETET